MAELPNIPGAPPLMIDSRETQRVLKVGERKLWTLVNMNAIPHRRVGRSIRFVMSELVAWINAGCPTDAGAGDRIRKGAR